MPILIAYVWHDRCRATIAAALSTTASCQFVESLAELDHRLMAVVPDAVILSLRTAHNVSTGGFATSLSRRRPGLPILGVVEPTPVDIREIRSPLNNSFSDFLIVGIDDIARTIDDVLCTARDRCDGNILESVRDKLSEGAFAVLHQCAEAVRRSAPIRAHADTFAESLGVSRRTLTRRFRAAGLPPPALVFRWVRLVLSAASLRHAGRSVCETARVHGYSDGQDYRKTLRRLTGLRPHEIRSDSGFSVLMDRFVTAVSAAQVEKAG